MSDNTLPSVVDGGDIELNDEELAGLEGLGYSEKADDSLIPIVSILQDNSGEVKKKHDRYIDGAEPGHIIIRSLQRVFKIDDDDKSTALLFQPCGFDHMWVEWEGDPGEGAPVGQHAFDSLPEDAREVADPQNPERTIWIRDNGNRLVDTRYHYGHILDGDSWMQAVIPMGGTNHTVSRQWTSLMKQHKVGEKRAPAWFRLYALTTKFTQRGNNSWYKYSVEDLGWISNRSMRDDGRRLFEAVKANEVTADISSEEGIASDTDAPI